MSNLTWPLASLAIGLILVVAEVVLPTAGVLLGASAVVLGLGLYDAFSQSRGLGFGFLAAEAVLVPLTVGATAFVLSRTAWRRGRASLAPPGESELDVAHSGPSLDELAGRPGRALTPLRPSGKVDFGGRRLDGVSEGGLIPIGASVTAVGVRGGRVVVRDCSAPGD